MDVSVSQMEAALVSFWVGEDKRQVGPEAVIDGWMRKTLPICQSTVMVENMCAVVGGV